MVSRPKLADINPLVICSICGGYLVDATTAVECMHSFCRSCIVRHIENSNRCPVCQKEIHNARPFLNLRPDPTRQDMVYKMIPYMYKDEMQRRRVFYTRHPSEDPGGSLEIDCEFDPRFFSPDDTISLSLDIIRSANIFSDGEESSVCYLKCPATFTIELLKKFLCMKFCFPSIVQIDVLYENHSIDDDLTLMDVAYIHSWKRAEPMRFFFSVSESIPESTAQECKHIHYELSVATDCCAGTADERINDLHENISLAEPDKGGQLTNGSGHIPQNNFTGLDSEKCVTQDDCSLTSESKYLPVKGKFFFNGDEWIYNCEMEDLFPPTKEKCPKPEHGPKLMSEGSEKRVEEGMKSPISSVYLKSHSSDNTPDGTHENHASPVAIDLENKEAVTNLNKNEEIFMTSPKTSVSSSGHTDLTTFNCNKVDATENMMQSSSLPSPPSPLLSETSNSSDSLSIDSESEDCMWPPIRQRSDTKFKNNLSELNVKNSDSEIFSNEIQLKSRHNSMFRKITRIAPYTFAVKDQTHSHCSQQMIENTAPFVISNSEAMTNLTEESVFNESPNGQGMAESDVPEINGGTSKETTGRRDDSICFYPCKMENDPALSIVNKVVSKCHSNFKLGYVVRKLHLNQNIRHPVSLPKSNSKLVEKRDCCIMHLFPRRPGEKSQQHIIHSTPPIPSTFVNNLGQLNLPTSFRLPSNRTPVSSCSSSLVVVKPSDTVIPPSKKSRRVPYSFSLPPTAQDASNNLTPQISLDNQTIMNDPFVNNVDILIPTFQSQPPLTFYHDGQDVPVQFMNSNEVSLCISPPCSPKEEFVGINNCLLSPPPLLLSYIFVPN